MSAKVFVFAKDRHESLGECPFCEQASQQIGQFESDEKSIRRHARAKNTRDQYIANNAKNTGKQRQDTDRSKCFEKVDIRLP